MPSKLKCPNCGGAVRVDGVFGRYAAKEALKCQHCETILAVHFRESAVLFGSVAGSAGALIIWTFARIAVPSNYADILAIVGGLCVMLVVMLRLSFVLLRK